MKKHQVTQEAWDQELPNTLYNRMKPEYMKRLESLATIYPTSFGLIVREFKETTLIIDCDFHVLDACRAMMDWDLNNLYQYFNKAR